MVPEAKPSATASADQTTPRLRHRAKRTRLSLKIDHPDDRKFSRIDRPHSVTLQCVLAILGFTGVIAAPMRQKIQLLTLLFAWFVATGAQWDVIQTFGWGRMLADYSRTMTFTAAVNKVLGGEMCNICKAVNKAERQDNAATLPGGKLSTKLLLVFQPVPALIFFSPESFSWSPSDQSIQTRERAAPPLPPPRLLAA